MSCVRYGMIGFGGIAENRLAKEGFACDATRFAPLGEARLVGVTDVNATRAEAAKALNLAWYDNANALLSASDIDAVVIATNNASHFDMASAALRAGKHVLVEKPLATTVADARALCALAAEKNLSLSVDHMMEHNVLHVQAARLVRSGLLGSVNDADFHIQFAFGYTESEAQSWRCRNVAEMGGPIGDVGSHCFYVAEHILGEPIASVAAVYYPKRMKTQCEDGALMRCTLASGLEFAISVSFCRQRGGSPTQWGASGFEIYGERGVLRSFGSLGQLSGHAEEPYKIRLELETKDGVRTLGMGSPQNIYQGIIKAHADSIKSGIRMTGENGVRNVELCRMAHISAKKNGIFISQTKEGNQYE